MQIQEITCNTPDEVLFKNIEQNTRRDLPWITQIPAHEGHAVIVGGGPSVVAQLDNIRWRQSEFQHVFALNNTVDFLAANGISTYYQVILDARPHNKRFVSEKAYAHLLASQCDPSLFDVSRGTILWNALIDGIEKYIPKGTVLIGGGTTVGLSAMALAYTMGYRKIHLFGYDSSYAEGQSHAYDQPENSYEPRCKVTVHGRTFDTSLAMAWQAELFQVLANNLIDAGCIITVDGDGLLPFMVRNQTPVVPMTEQQKYEAMWAHDQYREVAPGESPEHMADFLLHLFGGLNDLSGVSVIDFGSGTGRGAARLKSLTHADIMLVDFADNARDPDTRSLPFLQADLSEQIYLHGHAGYCTDVMEHIPPEKVDAVLENIMACVPQCFFAIDYENDNCGALIGHPLHLSVHDHQWWLDTFMRLGMGVEWSRDDGGRGCFHVIRHAQEAAKAAE